MNSKFPVTPFITFIMEQPDDRVAYDWHRGGPVLAYSKEYKLSNDGTAVIHREDHFGKDYLDSPLAIYLLDAFPEMYGEIQRFIISVYGEETP